MIITSNSCRGLALCRAPPWMLSINPHKSTNYCYLLLCISEKAETQRGWSSCLSYSICAKRQNSNQVCLMLRHRVSGSDPRLKGEMAEGTAWTDQDRNPQTTASSWASSWKNSAGRLLEIAWTFCSPPHLLDRKKIHETWKTKIQPYNIHGVPSLYHARTAGLLNQTPKRPWNVLGGEKRKSEAFPETLPEPRVYLSHAK